MSSAHVVAVCRDPLHRFSKAPVERITLVAGLGVADDAHAGTTVQHRSRVRRDPGQPNLRQVHLIHAELFTEAAAAGFRVGPGDLGENITTAGVALLELPRGTRLHLGASVVRLTGLRNPCRQINDFQAGLLTVVVARADGVRSHSQPALSATGGVLLLDDRPIARKAGVMGVVEVGGELTPGQVIDVELPSGAHHHLEPV